MAMKKLLLVLLPVLVALAAHYHRQGNLALPSHLQGPAEQLWQQLRVHLPLNVPANPLQGDTSAKQDTPTQGTTAKVVADRSLDFDMQTWLSSPFSRHCSCNNAQCFACHSSITSDLQPGTNPLRRQCCMCAPEFSSTVFPLFKIVHALAAGHTDTNSGQLSRCWSVPDSRQGG